MVMKDTQVTSKDLDVDDEKRGGGIGHVTKERTTIALISGGGRHRYSVGWLHGTL